MPDILVLTNPVAISLAAKDDPSSADEDPRRWVQVATEGKYDGYAGGTESFTLDEGVFKQVVNNLHSHPNYSKGEDGLGIAPIVPWDFEHASTVLPSEGSLPVSGSPAQGWTYDFEIRTNADGKTKELWALTEFLEPAKSYVQEGKYQWASISLAFDAVDQVSGDNVGALVMSIALTNTPFIEGMQKLAASRRHIVASELRTGKKLERWFYKAESPENAISQMKELFGLKETDDLTAIKTEISKVKDWIASDAIPPLMDVESIIQNLRTILNLSVLDSAEAVLDAAEKSLAELIPEDAAAPNAAMSNHKSATGRDSHGHEGGEAMDLLKILSELLGTRENDEAVVAEARAAVALRNQLQKVVNCSKDSNEEILAGVTEAVEQTVSAREKLAALAKALGVKDPEDAVDKIASLMEESKKLAEVMPELEQLRTDAAKVEEQTIENDVEQAMASRNIDEGMKDMLLLFRRQKPEKFAEKYPKIPAGPQINHNLKLDIATTASGAPKPVEIPTTEVGVNGSVVDLGKYPGSNPTARAMAHVKANAAKYGVDPNNHRAVWNMAVNLKNNRVPGEPTFIDSMQEGR